jgi:hypothetical protein
VGKIIDHLSALYMLKNNSILDVTGCENTFN